MTEENTIITQEFTIPPRRKKNTKIEINGIVFNNFLEMVEWISTAAKQIEELKAENERLSCSGTHCDEKLKIFDVIKRECNNKEKAE